LLDALWPRLLRRVGEAKVSLGAYLADSRPNRIEGDKLYVGLPGFALHQEVLSEPDNKKILQELLNEVCGRRFLVDFETLAEHAAMAVAAASEALAADEQGPPALVADIVKLFNATVIGPPKGS
jgi:hypothetical protein